ncbi:MAG: hypothetical protein IPL78_32725 [Chloroflexi bacterium]|nr:hypothetical protein [Chloroflexota bacterium]
MSPIAWKRYYQGQPVLLGIVLCFGGLGFIFLRANLNTAFVMFGILVVLVVMWLTLYETSQCRYRLVYLDGQTVFQVVKNVLNQKGLPFTERGRELLLGDPDLLIRIKANFNNPNTTYVLLEPYTEETKALIISLCQKFYPKVCSLYIIPKYEKLVEQRVIDQKWSLRRVCDTCVASMFAILEYKRAVSNNNASCW